MARRRQRDKKGRSSAKGHIARQPKPVKKQAKRPSKELVNHRHMQALAHPLRVQILAILAERIASPKEMSDELGEGVSHVAYHVKVLEECGLIAEDHRTPRRGAIEHFYQGKTPTIVPPGAWDNLPPVLRKSVAAKILRTFYDDASASFDALGGDRDELSWTPLILDAPGFKKLEQLTKDYVEAVQQAQKEASKRLRKAKGGEKNGTSATVFLASFRSSRSLEEGKKASAARRR